jgi:hypothetical protein
MPRMSDENQTVVPPSFIGLFVEPGRIKPNAPREFIAERHEFCDDLATMLVEPARTKRWELGADASDVLERFHRGLLDGQAGVSGAEAWWVIRRLAELLEWEHTSLPTQPPAND